jgi:GAF domain-containing protein
VDSRSEIVIPLIKNDVLVGVLDIDSPILACFDEDDRRGLERLASILLECSDC